MLLVIFATLAIAFAANTTLEVQKAANFQEVMKAQLAAESGLIYAIDTLDDFTMSTAPTASGDLSEAVYLHLSNRMDQSALLAGRSVSLAANDVVSVASLDGLTVDQLNATPENVIISSGSQQLLFILSDIFIDPGNIVIMAWPSYYVYTGTLQSMGAEVRTVEMDEAGIRTDDLENVLQSLAAEGKLQKVKILYLQTYHQNPTGLTLSAERRPIVVDLVKKYSTNHKILILEDAACRELTYEGQQLPSIKKYDPTNEFVLVTHTFSKTFAPGVRTGYALLPNDLVKPFMLQKGNHDFGSGSFCQHLLLAAMKKGVYQKHLAALCTRYTAKRDAMLEALEENLGGPSGTIRWHKPSGGLYVYLTFPETIDTGQDGQLFQAALNEGVLYLPGEFCFGPDPTRRTPRNTMRLCFGKVSIEQIRQGIVRLAKAIQTTQTSATGRS